MFPLLTVPDVGQLKGRVLIAVTVTANTLVLTFEPHAHVTVLAAIEHEFDGKTVLESLPLSSTTTVSVLGLPVRDARCEANGDLRIAFDGHSISIRNDEANYEAYSFAVDDGPEVNV